MASKEGWLERHTSWAVWKPWQRRYFLLRDNELSWHVDADAVEAERGTAAAIPWDISTCVVTDRQDVEHAFTIVDSEGRTLFIKAGDSEEKRRWMEALKPLHYGSSTFDVITRYICNAVLADVTNEEDTRHPRLDEFAGALLFTDISGFTKLSEKLRARAGSTPEAGGEILNKLINSFFSSIINVVLSHDGDVIKFAGDAMFVVWRCPKLAEAPGADEAAGGSARGRSSRQSTEAYRAAALQAAACAVDVMALDGQEVTGGGVTEVLKLKCGIGVGACDDQRKTAQHVRPPARHLASVL
eukprot:SAG22_NODE_87_length_21437_cov_14.162480_9_plen_299_part_00